MDGVTTVRLASLPSPRLQYPPLMFSAHRILLIDDHAMFRTGLCMVLQEGLPGVQILEAASMEEALNDTHAPPSVILLDIKLQGLNGLECLAVFARQWPMAPVIMLSSQDEPATVQTALGRGAAAFVSKAEPAAHILRVILQVIGAARADGGTAQAPRTAPPNDTPTLTPRQCEVLNLLCQGLPNKAIGKQLALTENTVRWHVQAVLGVLQVASRSEAIFVARRLGLVA